MKAGNWLRVAHGDRYEYNDNLIRIDKDLGERVNITYFYDWEDEKFLFSKPVKEKGRYKEEMNFYDEYTPKELIASIFEDPIEGSF